MREALLRLATGHVSRVVGTKNATSLVRRRHDDVARPKAIPDWLQCSFEVEDEAGTVVPRLSLSEAIK
jgi:hypothetical protein